jgi:hypothetical protein
VLHSGVVTTISSRSFGAGPTFSHAHSVTTIANGALVYDDVLDTLFSVNIKSGDRAVISTGVFAGLKTETGPAIGFPASSDLDSDGTRAYLLHERAPCIVAVDLATGTRSVLAGDGDGKGARLRRPFSLTVDRVNRRALVLHASGDRPLSEAAFVDLESGDRVVP